MRIVISSPDPALLKDLEDRGWEYEEIADDASLLSADEVDALVARTWSRAKKQFEFDAASAVAALAPDAALGEGTPSDAKAVNQLARAVRRLESSREYRLGQMVLRPLRAITGRSAGAKAKS